jgi:hypothetical protein
MRQSPRAASLARMAIDIQAVSRPQLKPAVARVWRAPATVQFGTGSEGWILQDLSPSLAIVLELCDGTRPRTAIVDEAMARGLAFDHVRGVLDALSRAGVLDDAAIGDRRLRELPIAERDRLEPERSALSLLDQRPGSGGRILARRRSSWIEIDGEARIVPLLAALFAAAGVGHVTARSATHMTAYDALPGGAPASAPVQTFARAAADAARSSSPAVSTDPPAGGRVPDLRVLAARGPVVDPAHAVTASADGAPLLAVHARELTGVVGPLVIAGETACLRCLDLHRSDRDVLWPVVAAQLANRRVLQPQPVAMLAILAGFAVTEGLAHLDGDERVASRNGTLELSPPDWRLRRRSWLPHPDCGCIWPFPAEPETFG